MGSRRRIVEYSQGGCYLSVEISPGASRTEVIGIDEWRNALKVSVSAPPVEGEANNELVRFISEMFPQAKEGIAIASGAKSRMKKLFIPLDAAVVSKKLGLEE